MPIKRYLDQLKRMHGLLTFAMVVLIVGSVAFIYSASYRGPDAPMPSLYKWQVVWFSLGLALYLVVALVDYRLVCQWAAVWYALAIGLLLLVLLVGKSVHGSKSWLGFGGFGIQPAEFAKLAAITALSYYLFHRTQQQRRQWATLLGAMALVGLPVLLILAQPDLGSAMVLLPICFGLLFVAGVKVKHLIVVALIGLALLPVAWWQLKPYQKARLTNFLHPERDPINTGWNLNQSLIAVGTGGWTGKGYLQGTQNQLGYMPRPVTPSDFLFTVIAEEKGFVGSVCVVGLYVVILFSGLRIAAEARDRLGMLLATGVVAMLFFHVFINVGMTIGLMPITGLPLPLLSYGGSFVLASMTALGLLQNVWIHRRVY
ncbi:MAG: Peptidoglycan glycosyltransferase MrdB [Verrucomicrobiae bacterium]|nr:Peptidoglycan glycosyltransferase MrdB [Verrucomicrobiae bacterium]